MKINWIQKTDKIKLNQGYHGTRWQGGRALDFNLAPLYAPADGEVTRQSGSGYSQNFNFTLFGFKENVYIQAVHGRPAKLGRIKKGELLGLCNSHHWHIALNVNGSWQSILDYTERSKQIELLKGKWTNPYDQWSFYNDYRLTPTAPPEPKPKPPAPQPQPQPQHRTYEVVSGDTLWDIARRELGSGVRWGEIWNLNKDQIYDPNLIKKGQIIKLPYN